MFARSCPVTLLPLVLTVVVSASALSPPSVAASDSVASALGAVSTPDTAGGSIRFESPFERSARSAASREGVTSGHSQVVARAVHAADDNIDCPHLEILMTKLPGWWRRPDTEFQATFRDAFAEQLRRVGFVVTPHAQRLERVPPWYVSTQVLDIGDGTIVWSWELKKQPTVISGSLHFDRFADPRGEFAEEFSGIQGLSRLSIQDFATTAIEASNEIAAVFLPHARRLCSDRNAALLAQQAQLERMRESLEQEIQRVRQQRAERQRTTLTIEAEER